MRWQLILLVLFSFLLASCQGGAELEPLPASTPSTAATPLASTTPLPPPVVSDNPIPTATIAAIPIPEYSGTNNRINDPNVYEYRALLPRDAIAPVYEPEFAPAGAVTLADEELVMGVAWGEEAKAYPVTVMRFREMVNDELAGIPILVTW